MAIETERVQIPGDAGAFGGYLARPEGDEALPAVIVYMEIFGVNSHIRDVTERVAAEGYVAIAPDYFHRTGPGVELGYDDAGMAEGMKLLGALQASEMVADAEALADRVRHAGAVFCGPWSPASLGDYVAGPSHVLPTAGTARFSGALTVTDFTKEVHVVTADRRALQRLAPHVAALADAEGLDAHAESVRIRTGAALRDAGGTDD